MRTLYRPLYLIETPIVFTGIETAELIKYAANSFLAMKVTFINEMADLCEKAGCGCPRCRARDRARRTHRPEIPPPRPGLRRLLLSEGHAGARPHRAGCRRAVAARRDRRAGQRCAQGRAWPRAIVAACGGLGARQDDRGARPDVQAGDRRHARRALAADRVAALLRTAQCARVRSRGHGTRRGRCCLTPSSTAATRSTRRTDADALVVVTEWNEFRAIAPARLKSTMRGERRRRSAQRLRSDRDAAGRLHLSLDRPAAAEPGSSGGVAGCTARTDD